MTDLVVCGCTARNNGSLAHLPSTIAAITYATRALPHRSFLGEPLLRLSPLAGCERDARDATVYKGDGAS